MPGFMKLEFLCQIFEKFSNIKLHENLLSGRRVVAANGREDGETEEGEEGNYRFTEFCESD